MKIINILHIQFPGSLSSLCQRGTAVLLWLAVVFVALPGNAQTPEKRDGKDSGGSSGESAENEKTFPFPWDGLEKSFPEQAGRDRAILLKTMFPDKKNYSMMKSLLPTREIELAVEKQNYLKRLFFVMSYCGLKYLPEDEMLKDEVVLGMRNYGGSKYLTVFKTYLMAEQMAVMAAAVNPKSYLIALAAVTARQIEWKMQAQIMRKMTPMSSVEEREYYKRLQHGSGTIVFLINSQPGYQYLPFSMAAVFSHGLHVTFELDKSIKAYDFNNFLLTGEITGSGHHLLFRRSAGAKGMVIDEGILMEVDRESVGEDSARHYGMNLAIGGVGAIDCNGDVIGPGGVAYKKENFELSEKGEIESVKPEVRDLELIEKRQHGHVYICTNEISEGEEKMSYMQTGLEMSQHLSMSMFGESRVYPSGEKFQQARYSVTGGNEWEAIPGFKKDSLPSRYGGFKVIVKSRSHLMKIESNCNLVLYLLDDALLEKVFKKVLAFDGSGSKRYIKQVIKVLTDTLKEDRLTYVNANNINAVLRDFIEMKRMIALSAEEDPEKIFTIRFWKLYENFKEINKIIKERLVQKKLIRGG